MPGPLTDNEISLMKVIEASTEAMASCADLLSVTAKSMEGQVHLLRKLMDDWWLCPSPFPHEAHEWKTADADAKHCVGRAG